MSDSDVLRDQLIGYLPTGKDFALKASDLASYLGTTTRMVGQLVADLVGDGWLICSSCSGEPGYYLPRDESEVEAGVAHIVSRAKASLHRVAVLRRNARERFGDHEVLHLFDMDGVA